MRWHISIIVLGLFGIQSYYITNYKKSLYFMTIQTVLIVLMIGLAAGTLSGLVGVGGGIIIVPALIYFLGFSQKMAQGTSLGILLLPGGILAVLNFYKQGYIDIRVVLILFVAFVIGGYFGSKLSVNISENKLKKVFAIMLLLIAAKMLFWDKPKTDKEKLVQKEKLKEN